MMKRQPFHRRAKPNSFLFSDERLENDVLRIAAMLPCGSGIILRHDHLPVGKRWRLARRLMRIAKRRGLFVALADQPQRAKSWGMDGVHLRQKWAHRADQAHALGLRISMPVHDRQEAERARQCGAHMVFISPLYQTRSHAGEEGLGMKAWLKLARQMKGAEGYALGGMDAKKARRLRLKAGRAIGWAAIDAHDQAVSLRLKRCKQARMSAKR